MGEEEASHRYLDQEEQHSNNPSIFILTSTTTAQTTDRKSAPQTQILHVSPTPYGPAENGSRRYCMAIYIFAPLPPCGNPTRFLGLKS
jgi:hypothetical protein